MWTALCVLMLRGTVEVIVRHAIARRTHQAATGFVERSWIESVSDSGGVVSHKPKVAYRYAVEGKQYTGDRFTYDSMGHSGGRELAERLVRTAPASRGVTVYYSPADPADSILDLNEGPLPWLILMVSIPFFAIELLLWYAFYLRLIRGDEFKRGRSRRRGKSGRDWDGIDSWGLFQRHRGVVSIRPPTLAWRKVLLLAAVLPLLVGLPLYGYTATVRDWVVSGRTVATAWAIVGGLLASSILLQIINRGPIVTIDPDRKILSLRSWRRREKLDFDAIACVSLRWIPSPILWGGMIRHSVLLLSIGDQAGREMPLQVFRGDEAGRKEASKALHAFAKMTRSEARPADEKPVGALGMMQRYARRLGPLSVLTIFRPPNIHGWLKYGDLI